MQGNVTFDLNSCRSAIEDQRHLTPALGLSCPDLALVLLAIFTWMPSLSDFRWLWLIIENAVRSEPRDNMSPRLDDALHKCLFGVGSVGNGDQQDVGRCLNLLEQRHSQLQLGREYLVRVTRFLLDVKSGTHKQSNKMVLCLLANQCQANEAVTRRKPLRVGPIHRVVMDPQSIEMLAVLGGNRIIDCREDAGDLTALFMGPASFQYHGRKNLTHALDRPRPRLEEPVKARVVTLDQASQCNMSDKEPAIDLRANNNECLEQSEPRLGKVGTERLQKLVPLGRRGHI